MARRDWYFAPVPTEMIKVIDEIFEKEGRRYGVDNRAEMIRAMLGDFIELYDKCGKSFTLTRRLIREMDCQDNNNSKDSPSSPLPHIKHQY